MHDLIIFLLAIAFFHVSEFSLVYVFVPSELSRDSWLISKPYCFAMGLALLEYLVESAFGVHGKGNSIVRMTGLTMILAGEAIRKCAIITARSNFTLAIRRRRQPEHQLVTSGIYSLCRHPGYLGWTIWSVGTQVFLQNPICFVIFIVWCWKFFSERIPYEEELLLNMFDIEYRKYAEKTRVWLPFIESPVSVK